MNARSPMKSGQCLADRPAVEDVKVWDLPTRLFHWMLVAAFLVGWLSRANDQYLDVHAFFGTLALALILWRIVWGLGGGHYARFSEFVYGWRVVRDYIGGLLRGGAPRYLGHNPIGGWAVLALLAVALVICVSGLAVLAGDEGHGILSGLMSPAAGLAAKALHRVLAWGMVALVAVHVAGVVVESRVHRENLVAAMIHGRKHARPGTPPSAAHRGVGYALLITVLVAAAVYFSGYLLTPAGQRYRPFIGVTLASNPTWSSECGDCHVAYHPSLLPARSWAKLLAHQDDHFGEDLALEPDTLKVLAKFAAAHSADAHESEPARKIDASIRPGDTPLRITATPYWRAKHDHIPKRAWKLAEIGSKGNCAACHADAKGGGFEDSGMRLPVDLDEHK